MRNRTGSGAFKALLSLLCAPQRWPESVRLLRNIQTGADSRLEPRPAAVSYASDRAARTGDLYRLDNPLAGLVLVPGITPLGKDDPRLIAFAQALAQARFEVLVPYLPGLQDLRVSAEDSAIIADALSMLSQHRSAQGNATLGLVAVCYSVGPAMRALLDTQARGAAHFMLAIGGYYDIDAVLTFMTTGTYRGPPDHIERYRAPDEYSKWVFANSIAEAVRNARDRRLLETMARRRLDDRQAGIADLVSALGDEGKRVYAMLDNAVPGQVAALFAALPGHIRDAIAEHDLKRCDFSTLAMRFSVIHGKDDAVIPETESMALAQALPHADLRILHSMQHVDPGPAGISDTLKLMSAVQDLLRQRDRARPPRVRPAASPLRFADCTGAAAKSQEPG